MIKQKQTWTPPEDGIRLALGTKEKNSETLEPLSKENCPNLEVNKCYLRFTEVEIDTRCPTSLHLYAFNSYSGTLHRYHYHYSRDLSNTHSYVLSTQCNRQSLNQKIITTKKSKINSCCLNHGYFSAVNLHISN